MASKADRFYFENFIAAAEESCRAAEYLVECLTNYEPDAIGVMLEKMHTMEHAADKKKHEMSTSLAKAFVTPIDREDLAELSQNIDEVTDKIEDVLLRVYCNNVQKIRPEALELSRLVIRCCEEAKLMAQEFADFKRSKGLRDHIIRINTLEEEADQQFINSMRTLHTTCMDPIEIIVWREIFLYLEKCVDACEHVADTVESVVMKNS